jgi:hypothetical protein
MVRSATDWGDRLHRNLDLRVTLNAASRTGQGAPERASHSNAPGLLPIAGTGTFATVVSQTGRPVRLPFAPCPRLEKVCSAGGGC